MKCLSSKKLFSSKEIENITKFTKSKVIRLLNSLVAKNYVKIYGSGRGTKYGI